VHNDCFEYHRTDVTLETHFFGQAIAMASGYYVLISKQHLREYKTTKKGLISQGAH
jgi:hypothetical protein